MFANWWRQRPRAARPNSLEERQAPGPCIPHLCPVTIEIVNAYATSAAPDPLLRTLADFRYELRRFLHFSESAAADAGLHPQQHQLLLQVAGAPEGTVVTIAYAAERLGLRHNSTVELVNRSASEGLLTRKTDADDRRRAILHLTHKGRQLLSRLSDEHACELNELAPRLEQALKHIRLHSSAVA
jgi:DNA-binding MarR family transcriptional regulator